MIPLNVADPLAFLACDNQVLSQASGSNLPTLMELTDRAREYVEESRSANTRRAYSSDWARFVEWCGGHGAVALPAAPVTVALYVTDAATTHRTSTIGRWLASVGQAHRAAGHDDPTKSAAVKATWRGIRRARGTAQVGKAPVLVADVRRIAATFSDTILGHRDRALLLLGFAGAFRRSELVGLNIADLSESSDGITVTISRSKTDQEGAGRMVGIPYGSHPETCPVRAIRRWLEELAVHGVIDGPLLRSVDRHGRIGGRLSGHGVALVVKKLASAAGIDPATVAGHSLRSGLATSASMAGASEADIMRQTGHKSVTVARRYIRAGSLFRSNVAASVGL